MQLSDGGHKTTLQTEIQPSDGEERDRRSNRDVIVVGSCGDDSAKGRRTVKGLCLCSNSVCVCLCVCPQFSLPGSFQIPTLRLGDVECVSRGEELPVVRGTVVV